MRSREISTPSPNYFFTFHYDVSNAGFFGLSGESLAQAIRAINSCSKEKITLSSKTMTALGNYISKGAQFLRLNVQDIKNLGVNDRQAESVYGLLAEFREIEDKRGEFLFLFCQILRLL